MYQTVDVAFQANEDTEIGDRLDSTRDFVAFVVLSSESIPRVLLTLFDTQRNTTTLFVDIKNHNFDLVAQLNDLRRMHVLVRPIHFANVN